jgi:DNA-directed RNA polymerase specialized sigma54-like protein
MLTLRLKRAIEMLTWDDETLLSEVEAMMRSNPGLRLGDGRSLRSPFPWEARIAGRETELECEVVSDVQLCPDAEGLSAEARFFVGALERRVKLLADVLRRCAHANATYLFSGEAPTPLWDLELAVELGVHVTTIRRCVQNKRVETPRGILQLASLIRSADRIEGKVLAVSGDCALIEGPPHVAVWHEAGALAVGHELDLEVTDLGTPSPEELARAQERWPQVELAVRVCYVG